MVAPSAKYKLRRLTQLTDITTPRVDRMAVEVDCHTSAGDGGGGTFVWDPASTEDADGGVIVGSGNGRWKRMVDGMYNLRWFGAVGDGVTWDTDAWSDALEYCSKKSAGLWVPPGKYRIASGYTQSTAYRDVFIKGCGRVGEASSARTRSSTILLDSSNAATFFLSCTASMTLRVEGMCFEAAQDVSDRKGFYFNANTPHFFSNCSFDYINRPIVYGAACTWQSAAFRDVQFRNGGSIHSEIADGTVCTFLVLDNVNHEGVCFSNSSNICMDLTNIRKIVADNLLLEGAFNATGGVALKLANNYDQYFQRHPFATIRGYHCEWSTVIPGTYVCAYSVQQIGGSVTIEQASGIGGAGVAKYSITEGGRAVIYDTAFTSESEDPTTYFELEDTDCTVLFDTCSIRSIYRDRAGFSMQNCLSAEPAIPDYSTCVVSNTSAQEVWRWQGGYLAAEGCTVYLGSSNTYTPSSDASYKRKLVVTPSGNTFDFGITIPTNSVIGSGDQLIVMARMKLPTYTGGTLQVYSQYGGSADRANNYLYTTGSAATIDVMIPTRIEGAASTIGIYIGGSQTGVSGTVEIYSLALYHGESVPRRQVSSYPVNVVTFAAAAPTTGAWVVGDVVKNNAPAVGNPKGWVCTVAGTPGTWVSEGNL